VNHRAAKSFEDVSFHSFKQKLLWKADEYGKKIVKIRGFH
jgi:transposase